MYLKAFFALNSCCHVLCQTLKSKSTCSLVHLCHHRTWDNLSNSHLSHLPATEVATQHTGRKRNSQPGAVCQTEIPHPQSRTWSHKWSHRICELWSASWTENLIQPTHSIASDLYTPGCVCIPKNSYFFFLCNVSYNIYLPLKECFTIFSNVGASSSSLCNRFIILRVCNSIDASFGHTGQFNWGEHDIVS